MKEKGFFVVLMVLGFFAAVTAMAAEGPQQQSHQAQQVDRKPRVEVCFAGFGFATDPEVIMKAVREALREAGYSPVFNNSFGFSCDSLEFGRIGSAAVDYRLAISGRVLTKENGDLSTTFGTHGQVGVSLAQVEVAMDGELIDAVTKEVKASGYGEAKASTVERIHGIPSIGTIDGGMITGQGFVNRTRDLVYKAAKPAAKQLVESLN